MQLVPAQNISHSAYSRQKRLIEIGVITLGFVLIPAVLGFFPALQVAGLHDAASVTSLLGFTWQLVLIWFLIDKGMPRLLKAKEYWAPSIASIVRGCALGVILLALGSIPGLFFAPQGEAVLPFKIPVTIIGWAFLACVLVLAVLVEELLYRVYYLERLTSLGANQQTAVLISVPLFAVGHAYQGPAGIAVAALAGTVLALSWFRWKSYWVNCVGHLVYNVTVLTATLLHNQ